MHKVDKSMQNLNREKVPPLPLHFLLLKIAANCLKKNFPPLKSRPEKIRILEVVKTKTFCILSGVKYNFYQLLSRNISMSLKGIGSFL